MIYSNPVVVMETVVPHSNTRCRPNTTVRVIPELIAHTKKKPYSHIKNDLHLSFGRYFTVLTEKQTNGHSKLYFQLKRFILNRIQV